MRLSRLVSLVDIIGDTLEKNRGDGGSKGDLVGVGLTDTVRLDKVWYDGDGGGAGSAQRDVDVGPADTVRLDKDWYDGDGGGAGSAHRDVLNGKNTNAGAEAEKTGVLGRGCASIFLRM